MDASAQDQQLPPLGVVIGAMLVVAAAAVVAVVIYDGDATLTLKPEGIAIFAPLYVAAQAIERLLEPLASLVLTPNEEKDDVKQAREEKLRVTEVARAMAIANPGAVDERGLLTARGDTPDVTAAATKEQLALHRLRRKRAIRKLVWWAVATVAGLLLCGALGLGILEAMSDDADGWTDRQHSIDIVLTGLVIGAGTKPLHDLITRLEKAKDNADPATKPTEKLPAAR
jgi:hypothetical protein